MSASIAPTTPTTAPEATKPLLAQMKSALGMIPNVYATIGHAPGSLQSVLAWDAAVGKGSLGKREIEMLNIHVSELNGCGYCLSAHAVVASRAGLSENDIESARTGVGTNERERALLALARRVVRTGGSGARGELVQAREAGLSDADIIDTLAIVAIKTFTNAVAIVGQVEIDFPKVARLPGG